MDNPQPAPENQNPIPENSSNPPEAEVPNTPIQENPETVSATATPENSTQKSPATASETPPATATPETPPSENPGTSKRIKFLLALIAITVIGAIAYFLSTSVIFKGAFITPGSPEEVALKEALDNASKSEKADYETKYIAKHKDETNGIDRTLEMTTTGQIDFKGDGNGLTHNFTFAGSGSTEGVVAQPPPPPPPPPPPVTPPAKPILESPADNAVVTLPLKLKWQDPENTLDKENKYNWYIKDDSDKKVPEANWSKDQFPIIANCGLPAAKDSKWTCSADIAENILESGKTYKWAVKSGDEDMASGYTDEWTFTVEGFDDSIPKNLKISYAVGEKKLKLKWEKVPQTVNQYLLYRKEGTETKQPTMEELQNSKLWTKIETKLDNTTETPYHKDEPDTGWQKTYSYVVTAKTENEESDPSNIAISDPDKVWKAVLLEIFSISAKEVKLRWTSTIPLEDGTKFHIKRSLQEPTFQDADIAATGLAVWQYSDKNLPSEKNFYYKIWRMKDGEQYPQVSNSEEVVFPVAQLTAKNPVMKKGENPVITWDWKKPFDESFVDKYYMYTDTEPIDINNLEPSSGPGNAGPYKYEITDPAKKEWTDINVEGTNNENTHYYALIPFNKNGEPVSISENQAEFKSESALKIAPTIQLTGKQIGPNKIEITWTGGDTNPQADKYDIYIIEGSEVNSLDIGHPQVVIEFSDEKKYEHTVTKDGDYSFVVIARSEKDPLNVIEISNTAIVTISKPAALTLTTINNELEASDKVEPIGTVNPNVDPTFKGNLFFKDENLTPGKKYYYKFLLKKEDKVVTIESESNEVVVYTQQEPVSANLNPSEDGLSGVITWSATSKDSADYYKVYRNQGPFPKYSNNDGQLKFSELEKMTPLSGEIKPDDIKEYTDETLPANENKLYYYTVASFKDGKIVAASYPKQILSPKKPTAYGGKTSFWKPFASLLFADVTDRGDGNDKNDASPIIKETIAGSGSLTYSAPKADGTSGLSGVVTIKDEYKVFDRSEGTTQLGETVTATLTLTVKDNKIEKSEVKIVGENDNLAFVTEQYVAEIFKSHLKVDTFVENHEKESLKNLKNGIKNNTTKSEFIGTNMEILGGGKFKTQTRKILDSNQHLASYLNNYKTDELNITVDATKKLPAFEGKLGFTKGNEFSYKVYNFTPAGGQGGQPPVEEKIPLTVTATTDGKVTLTWEDSDYVANVTEYQVYRTDSTFEIKKGDDAGTAMLTGRELAKVKGKTHQDQVQAQSTVKKYYYAVALLDAAKKVIKTSEVKEVSVGQEQQGCTGICALGGIAPGGNTNFQVGVGAGGGGGGGGTVSLQTLLAMQAAKEKAEKEKAAKEKAAKEKLKPAAPKNPYTDVTAQTEGYDAIMRLTEQGVVEGYEEKGKKLFKPNKPVIRAEAAKLILKGVCVEPGENAKNKKQVFSDVKVGKDIWFFPHTKETYLRGFFTGYKGNEDSQGRPQFKPENKITRAELTKVLIEVLSRQKFIKVPPVGKTEPWWNPFLKIGKTIDLYWQDKTKMPAVKQIITDEEAKKPTQSLTRAQTAIMIDRTLSLIGGCSAGAKPAANTTVKTSAKPADKTATKPTIKK